ncbi:hypothetical protein GCM10028812_22990 [Ancylobacter sonchi]
MAPGSTAPASRLRSRRGDCSNRLEAGHDRSAVPALCLNILQRGKPSMVTESPAIGGRGGFCDCQIRDCRLVEASVELRTWDPNDRGINRLECVR